MSAQDEHHPQSPVTMNWADYVDSLLRPRSDHFHVERETIQGRRLRDQYRKEVNVTRLVRDET
ncbi:MAG: hypothetical protein WDZ63_12310 [Burkholderiales bacterium]